jgi:hypothetical protein
VFGMEFLFFPLNLLKRSKVGEPLINLVWVGVTWPTSF